MVLMVNNDTKIPFLYIGKGVDKSEIKQKRPFKPF